MLQDKMEDELEEMESLEVRVRRFEGETGGAEKGGGAT